MVINSIFCLLYFFDFRFVNGRYQMNYAFCLFFLIFCDFSMIILKAFSFNHCSNVYLLFVFSFICFVLATSFHSRVFTFRVLPIHDDRSPNASVPSIGFTFTFLVWNFIHALSSFSQKAHVEYVFYFIPKLFAFVFIFERLIALPIVSYWWLGNFFFLYRPF